MKITRIEVEEGWLDGLDLEFGDGLNVLIGPRGTGKTSIIELIRYCLGIPAYTDEIGQASRNQALTILGSGQVSLTIQHQGEEIYLTRTRDEADASRSLSFPLPILLSQNEIEKVALQGRGKLRLIDSFMSDPSGTKLEETSLLSEIESLTVQMQSIRDEIISIDDRISELSSVDSELTEAQQEQEAQSQDLSEMQLQQNQLAQLANRSASLSVRIDYLNRVSQTLGGFRSQLAGITQFPPSLESWPEAAGPEDEVNEDRELLERSLQTIRAIEQEVITAISGLKSTVAETQQAKIALEKDARSLRKQIESIQKGAGALARRIADLMESKSQRETLKGVREERLSRLDEIRSARSGRLDKLDELREAKYQQREAAAMYLNEQLSPLIQTSLLRGGIFDEYETAISETLRGSGIHYNVLSPVLARKMSPRELGEALEAGNAEVIAELADIPLDRGQRLVSAAHSAGVHKIMSCRVEDAPVFKLLVGSEYKPSEKLSTGQRCTVILPILLSDHGRALIVDQPEDNLDNAFIVDSVVRAIRSASSRTQIICSTHNPNIPVLGEANRVILLGSDGSRGFVRHADELEASSSIQAITTVMEGGLEAFQRRAEFYAKESA